jgi:DNA-binding NarL/FixJ family response regulator
MKVVLSNINMEELRAEQRAKYSVFNQFEQIGQHYKKHGLSTREAEVGYLVTKGLSNKEIANQLFVTEATVKRRLSSIYAKLSVKSRAQLIVWSLPYLGQIWKIKSHEGGQHE